MKVIDYLKEAFRLTSMIFTILVIINLIMHKEVLFMIIEFLLFVSIISGLFVFLVVDYDKYSNRRLLINKLLYLALIFGLIIFGNVFFNWGMGVVDLVFNFLLVLAIFLFLQYIMYSNDRKEANEINQYIQAKKRDTP